MLFQELDKLKRSSIMISIILMALGIVMVICPQEYVMSLVDVLGYGMLISAIVLVLDFISSKKTPMNYVSFTVALILAILGASVLVFENHVVRVLGLTFGLVLIISSLIDGVNAMMYARRSQRKGWWVLMVFSALQILFGLIILLTPGWKTPLQLFDVLGGVLMFSSAVGIVRTIFLWPIKIEEGGV